MNDHKLDSVTAEKDLGIWISHDLKAYHSSVYKHIQMRASYWESSSIKCEDVGNLLHDTMRRLPKVIISNKVK